MNKLGPDFVRKTMESKGFKEAEGLVKHPFVPGSDGCDTYWWREEDRFLIQISWSTGEIEPTARIVVNAEKNFTKAHCRKAKFSYDKRVIPTEKLFLAKLNEALEKG